MDDVVRELKDRLGPVGIWTPALEGLPVGEAGDFAGRLESLGVGGLWFGEAYGREAFTQASVVLDGSSQLVVGTSIANIYGRDAMAARGAQATLGALHPGRFVLGLGVSHAPLVERMRGHDASGPLGAMRQYLQAMDTVQPVAVDAAPARPRLVAALGPRMLDLSAELADGAVPYLTLPEHTAEARDRLGPDKVLVVEAGCVLVDDPDEAQRRTHDHLEVYTGLPNYRNSWYRQGFGEQDTVRGGSQRLKDALVTRGMDATLARIREHLDAGADQVAVQVLGTSLWDPATEDIASLMGAADGIGG